MLAEIHCYMSALKSWHNNLFLSGVKDIGNEKNENEQKQNKNEKPKHKIHSDFDKIHIEEC